MSSTSLIDSFEETLIPMGGIGISKEKNVLKTFVGSCIALCIYDIEKKKLVAWPTLCYQKILLKTSFLCLCYVNKLDNISISKLLDMWKF